MATTKRIRAARAFLLIALLLDWGVVQAKKPLLHLYEIPGEAINRVSPGNACQVAIEHYSQSCPGAFILLPGCPAWSDLTPPAGFPNPAASISWEFYVREFTRPCTGDSFDRHARMTAFCMPQSANGYSYVYVGNGECRCPMGRVEDSAGNCVTSCPVGTAASNGVCVAATPKRLRSN